MGKKIKISLVWYLPIITALICAAVIVFFYLQVQAKETELARYEQAKICQDAFSCRQTQTAVILHSETQESNHITTGRGYNRSTRLVNTTYYFRIGFEDRQIESRVVTKFSIEKNSFNIDNIYVPGAYEKYFATTNLPRGKQIKIELWEDQVTFILTDVFGTEYSEGNFFRIIDLTQSGTAPEESRPTLQVVIPTTNHPFIALRQAQEDLLGSLLGAVLILAVVILLTLRFRKAFWRPHAIIH